VERNGFGAQVFFDNGLALGCAQTNILDLVAINTFRHRYPHKRGVAGKAIGADLIVTIDHVTGTDHQMGVNDGEHRQNG